jgi:hypothetical protein
LANRNSKVAVSMICSRLLRNPLATILAASEAITARILVAVEIFIGYQAV